MKMWPEREENEHKCVLSAVTNQLGDQIPGVPGAWAGLRLALLGMGTDEEQPAVPDLWQGESVVEVGDARRPWKVLKEAWHVTIRFVRNQVQEGSRVSLNRTKIDLFEWHRKPCCLEVFLDAYLCPRDANGEKTDQGPAGLCWSVFLSHSPACWPVPLKAERGQTPAAHASVA